LALLRNKHVLTYRAEIDGIRAIAVLAVMVAHSDIGILPGGFAGVDIFFVISGYLISGIILRDLENGEFSFSTFYKRRAKRIFPALFAMLFIVSLAAWFLLTPSELTDYSASVFFSLFFLSSSFVFAQEDLSKINIDNLKRLSSSEIINTFSNTSSMGYYSKDIYGIDDYKFII